MNASELKYHVESAGHVAYFFTRQTMRFFGDTMRNYGVRSATVRTHYDVDGTYTANGVDVDCWELYRRRPVKHGLQSSTFFCKETFKRIYPARQSTNS